MTSERHDARISYAVARLERALRARLAAAVAPYGVSVPQYTALSLLRDQAGLSNAQLARRTYVTPQAMGEVMRALDTAGLIDRTADPKHQRTLRTAVTRKGRRVLQRCDAAVDAMEGEMFPGVPAGRVDELTATLTEAVYALGAGRLDTNGHSPRSNGGSSAP